ncbi:ferritin-like domain-containing protein [Parachitinimonas caeni]|uniref:Ferritin-like domain-containing protein n=1 Tax=Parachitinimonas caeni TaxID=3031301 RepID=A0ABT7DUF3_9NEIS|nr:ferritin-like domain-containing protein [Parachitinimonas caeni]MDK2123710.1 ferritin-like domain-containing protein [Parachitinimonas caeni]
MRAGVRAEAAKVLTLSTPEAKVAGTQAVYQRWLDGLLTPESGMLVLPNQPGRPSKPVLISPQEVPRRRLNTPEGRAALIHAIAHIEFNAIDLALDAVARFDGMPESYYADWLRVAAEEALHFSLLQGHLQTLGYDYGDFPAHRGLWDMADRTRHDVLDRMALVPRLLEARGLDATPGIQARLTQVGDLAAVSILDVVLRDEIGHVAIGNRWYHWLCEQRGLAPLPTFRDLLDRYQAPRQTGVPNREARRLAGFNDEELAVLLDYWEG